MEKVKFSISPITIEIEASEGFFAKQQNPLTGLITGLLGGLSIPQGEPAPVEEAPTATEQAPAATEEAPTATEQAPAATEEAPKPKRTRKAAAPEPVQEEAPVQEESAQQEAPSEVTFAAIREKAIGLQSTYFKEIKAQLSSIGCARLSELEEKPEHFAAMMDFLNSLEDAN